jgi:hypothetical protein
MTKVSPEESNPNKPESKRRKKPYFYLKMITVGHIRSSIAGFVILQIGI